MWGINFQGVGGCLASNLNMRTKKENIDGVDCFVLEGTSKYGKIIAWVAPEKGYNALKWSFEYNRTHLSEKKPNIESGTNIFVVEEFHEIKNGRKVIFVPKQANLKLTSHLRNGTQRLGEYEYRTSDIQINPDFEAMGAFEIDYPDGIRVFDEKNPDVKYRWEKGKPVAFGKYENSSMENCRIKTETKD